MKELWPFLSSNDRENTSPLYKVLCEGWFLPEVIEGDTQNFTVSKMVLKIFLWSKCYYTITVLVISKKPL